MFRRFERRQHDHEFVAARASYEVARTQTALDAPAYRFKQHVSRGVAERVVNGFETVDVDEEYGSARRRDVFFCERFRELFAQAQPIGKIGQHVEVS